MSLSSLKLKNMHLWLKKIACPLWDEIIRLIFTSFQKKNEILNFEYSWSWFWHMKNQNGGRKTQTLLQQIKFKNQKTSYQKQYKFKKWSEIFRGWNKINTYKYLYSEAICQMLKRNKDFSGKKKILREFIIGGPVWKKNVNKFLREKKNDIDGNSDK